VAVKNNEIALENKWVEVSDQENELYSRGKSEE